MNRIMFISFFFCVYFLSINAQTQSIYPIDSVKAASDDGFNNKVEVWNWAPSVRIIASPPNENTQCMSSLEFFNKGLGGLEHKWIMQTSSNTDCWGVKPNGCEIWEYPGGENAKRRFAIQTCRGQDSYSCITIGPRGGVNIGYDPYFTATDINDLSVNGNVGIGTLDTQGHKLAVNGTIRAKEIKVESNWADFVFKKGYKLPTLKEVETHINNKGTLPGVPSESEVKANGVNLAETDALLLQKIEELTLYVIKQQKEIDELKSQIKK